MTPTPDPPPAAPLTAEEIAAIKERSDATRSVLDANAHRTDEQPWFLWYRCHETQLDEASLLASHAALSHRLARAEAEREELRALMNEWEYQGSTRSIQYRDDLCERWLAALAPTAPSDGAARAGGRAPSGQHLGGTAEGEGAE